MEIRIEVPCCREDIRHLKAGDNVLISGTVIAARDAAHKRLAQCVANNETLPIDLKNQFIYYMGPSPAKPNQIIGSAGPTTSGRMDPYTNMMLDLGITGMIGKGYRSPEVLKAISDHQSIYFVVIGGAGALMATKIKSYDVLAYEDLGPEAIARLEIEDFPAIVAVDSYGTNFYNIGQKIYRK